MTTLHPELTFADILTNFEHVQSLSDDSLSKTNVDLLEVHQTEKRQAKCIWHTALDEKSLPQLFKRRSDRGLLEIAGVRVMFLKAQPDGKGVQVHPSIVQWLHHQFNVSPTFMSHIVGLQPDTFGLLGDACLSERVDEKVTSLSGFYRCSNGILARIATFVWFFHDLAAQSSIYIVYGCTKDAKDQILRLALGKCPATMLRPFIIDAIIANNFLHLWGKYIVTARKELISHENSKSQAPSSDHAAQIVQNLHDLSQRWYIISAELDNFNDRLDYLIGIHKTYLESITDLKGDTISRKREGYLTGATLEYLQSRNRAWKRWVGNYNERTTIRINLYFHLASQSDSKTNLEIADLTTRIAIDTQRDSSAMITVAGVTMFFLPGTFVCAIFSMVFFNITTDSDGREVFQVSSRWWYYLVVTIPLTILVFVIWLVWKRQREQITGLVQTKHGLDQHVYKEAKFSTAAPVDNSNVSLHTIPRTLARVN